MVKKNVFNFVVILCFLNNEFYFQHHTNNFLSFYKNRFKDLHSQLKTALGRTKMSSHA